MKNTIRRFDPAPDTGMVLIPALIMVVILGLASSAFMMMSISSSQETHTATDMRRALYVAEAGMADALVQLAPTLATDVPGNLGTENAPVASPGGSYWVTGTKDVAGMLTLVATGRRGNQKVTVTGNFEEPLSLRDFAVYAGNHSGDAGYDFHMGGTGSSADTIQGKIFIGGDVDLTEDSEVVGDATATGEITGNPITGNEFEHAPAVHGPDLAAMNYASTADFHIDATTTFDGSGRLPSTDPRHIFVKNFRTDLATSAGFAFDNTNYFLGDPYEGSSLSRISVPAAGNRKVYYVEGNLWIEPDGTTSSIINSPPEGTVITIVVKGNIYFADNFVYDPNKDGVLFVAMSDGESYTDLDGDNQYDVGEPILHDDGDGIYQGKAEGSGNIFFGDPNGGPIGDIQGFLYAENHFEDHVRNSGAGDPLAFSVDGFLSAGEQVRVNRDWSGGHEPMEVTYDSRIEDGVLGLPGFPGSTSSRSDWTLRCWRVSATQ
ncbi:MAG: hypothetical protein H6830_07955 [Planctomycetes bacterium]|nr:hypothetical protein [Planctomycetota bacterium]MCB9909790.1 hypothetical protein [Planctomycetota bacterium]MCB9912301.1 hypothetical protein [Planctomycetota bacterium]